MDWLAPISRHVAHPLWAWRDGSPRLRYLRELERSQWLDAESLQQVALARLRALLAHAVERCPWYRRQARELGLDPRAVRQPSDLLAWPVLERSHLQAHAWELVAEGWPQEDLLPYTTGGSTGAPVRFFLHAERVASRTATMWRHDRWAGWELGQRMGQVWGASRDLAPPLGARGRVRRALLDRWLQLDATHLTPEMMLAYVSLLRRLRPPVVLAYAQAAVAFARFLREQGLSTPRLRGLITSAEVLTEEDRQLIEAAFGCRVYNRYGSREVGLIASECGRGEGLHISAESVWVEFVRDGRHVAPGELGEVLVTDLRNRALPLIRYRIGDLGSPAEGACPCGRGLPRMQMVAGRATDFLLRRDGGLVSGVTLVTYAITGLEGVGQVQLVQPSVEELVVRVVPGPGFTPAVLARLRGRLERYLGEIPGIRFELLEAIAKEPSGKYRFSISRVAPQWAAAGRGGA